MASTCEEADMPSTGTALTPEDSSAASRVQLIVQALERSGRGAPVQRFGALLRSWAKKGRPYRGQVFSSEEVEAAITMVDEKQKAEAAVKPAAANFGEILGKAAELGAISRIEVKAKAWPPPDVVAAGAEVACRLGTVPAASVQGAGGREMLKGLLGLLMKQRPCDDVAVSQRFYDVQIATSSADVSIPAHRAVLACVSDMLACRFSGRFGDTGSVVDASDFSAEVVYAAVKFAYLGVCRVRASCLGSLFWLADKWQFRALTEAVQQTWGTVPAACCLQILSQLQCNSPIPADMLRSVVGVVVDTLHKAAEVLSCGSLAAPAGAEGLPVAVPQSKIMLSWRFLRELYDVLVEMPAEAIAQLARWVSQDESLTLSAVSFFVTALQALASATGVDDVRQLCSKPLKAWLGPEIVVVVVERMCQALGLTDESGNERPWLRWAYTGCSNFPLLWSLYGVLQEHHRKQVEAVPESPMPSEENLFPAEPVPQAPKEFPGTLDAAFAAAIVDAIHNGSPDDVQQWEALILRDDAAVAAKESLALLARMLGHRRSVPKGLSPKGMHRVLSSALDGAPPAVVRVVGPEHLAGIYERQSRTVFLRQPGKKPMMLQRVVRARGRTICMAWRGIPAEALQSARAEWKIQGTQEDAEVDTPAALALDSSDDPSKIVGSWWVLGRDRTFRQSLSKALTVLPEAVSQTVLTPCVDAVSSWISGGGSLEELETTAASDALTMQVCRETGVSLGREPAGCQEEGVKRAAEECKQAEDAAMEPARKAAKLLGTDEESPEGQVAQASATNEEQRSPEVKRASDAGGPQTPPPRTPRWHAAPSPPCWPVRMGVEGALGHTLLSTPGSRPLLEDLDQKAAATAAPPAEATATEPAAPAAAAASETAPAEEQEDPKWEESSRIVDETSAKVRSLMEQVRTAPKKEKQALLAQKRVLESEAKYLAALRYLEGEEDAA